MSDEAQAKRLRKLEEIAKRLAAIRNSVGHIDLTDSSKRDEIYAIVALSESLKYTFLRTNQTSTLPGRIPRLGTFDK